jgi:hypothetical protein
MKSITTGNLIVRGNVDVVAAGQVIVVGNVYSTMGYLGNVSLDGGNVFASGQVNTAGNVVASFFVGNGSQLTGIAFSPPAITSADIRGNIIGAYANVANVIAGAGNIGTLKVTGNITGSNIVLTGGQVYQPIRYAQYKGIGSQVINTGITANVQFEKGMTESFGNVGLAVSNTGNTTFTNVSGGPMLLQINAIIPTQVGTYGTWGTTAFVLLKRVSGGNTTVVSSAAMTNTVTNFYNKMDYAIATPLYLPNNGDVFYFNMYVESTTGGSMTITDTNTVGNSTLNITRLI